MPMMVGELRCVRGRVYDTAPGADQEGWANRGCIGVVE